MIQENHKRTLKQIQYMNFKDAKEKQYKYFSKRGQSEKKNITMKWLGQINFVQ